MNRRKDEREREREREGANTQPHAWKTDVTSTRPPPSLLETVFMKRYNTPGFKCVFK